MICICSTNGKKALSYGRICVQVCLQAAKGFEPRWATSAHAQNQTVPHVSIKRCHWQRCHHYLWRLTSHLSPLCSPKGTCDDEARDKINVPVLRFRIKFHVYVSVPWLPSSTLLEQQILMYGWWKKRIPGNHVRDGGKEIHKCFINRCHFAYHQP